MNLRSLPPIGEIWQRVLEIAQDPASNLTAALLLLAVIALIALIFIAVLGLFLVIFSPEDDEDDDEDEDEEEGEGPAEDVEHAGGLPSADAESSEPTRWTLLKERVAAQGRWIRLAAIALVALAVIWSTVLVYGETGEDQYCAQMCHANSAFVKRSNSDAHKDLKCVECHESGIADAGVQRFTYIAAQVLRRKLLTRSVPSERCLRCHGSINKKLSVDKQRGLKVSHSEPIRAGMACDDCHAAMGHDPRTPGMSTCLRCHDAKTASAECKTCHTGDTSMAKKADYVFPKTKAANRDCGGCHDLRPCDACHGVRMPHSTRFLQYGHAREAVFQNKTKCLKCHPNYRSCLNCHGDFLTDAHGPGMMTLTLHRSLHTPEMLRQPQVACTCHAHNQYQNFCALCHDNAGGPLFVPGAGPASEIAP